MISASSFRQHFASRLMNTTGANSRSLRSLRTSTARVKRKFLPKHTSKKFKALTFSAVSLGCAGLLGWMYFGSEEEQHDKSTDTSPALGNVVVTLLSDKLHQLNIGVANGSGDKSLLLPHEKQKSCESEQKWVDINPCPKEEEEEEVKPPNLWVITFTGDAKCSQVESLRDEITAVIQNSNPQKGDHVLVRLKSGGGTVQGYGLAASQLQRVKAANLHLTVCIDEVAASGGYLMASTADVIVAAPFSVIGSIGVVQSNENYHELLERLGVRHDTITAGESKVTLSPGKKITEADLIETKKELEETHQLFKDTVARHRPNLNIDQVASGKVWNGTEALRLGLIDEIGVSDDVLLGFSHGNRVISRIITVATNTEEKVLKKQDTSDEGAGVSSNEQGAGSAECTLESPNEQYKSESTKSKVMFISCPKEQKVESGFTFPGLAKLAVKEVIVPMMCEEVSDLVASSGATMCFAGDSHVNRSYGKKSKNWMQH